MKNKHKKVFEDATFFKEVDREDQNPEEATKYRSFGTVENRKTYRSKKREIYRAIFRELSTFLFRIKYLNIPAIED